MAKGRINPVFAVGIAAEFPIFVRVIGCPMLALAALPAASPIPFDKHSKALSNLVDATISLMLYVSAARTSITLGRLAFLHSVRVHATAFAALPLIFHLSLP